MKMSKNIGHTLLLWFTESLPLWYPYGNVIFYLLMFSVDVQIRYSTLLFPGMLFGGFLCPKFIYVDVARSCIVAA